MKMGTRIGQKVELFVSFWGVFVLVAFLYFSMSANAAQFDTKSVLAGSITELEGSAVVKRSGEKIPAKIGLMVYQKDIVETSAKSKARVKLLDNSQLCICENTKLDLSECEFSREEKVRCSFFNVVAGRIVVFASKMKGYKKDHFNVCTPTATCGLRGTTFSVAITATGLTVIAVLEGELSVSNSQGQVLLTDGEKSSLMEGTSEPPSAPVALSQEDIDLFASFGFRVSDPLGLLPPPPPRSPANESPASPVVP